MKFDFNLYKILEVEDNVLFEELKKKYRKLSQKYHPDIPKTGDEELFKKVSIAYGILSDPEKRKLYDLGKWDELEPESKIALTEAEQNIIALIQNGINKLLTGEIQDRFLHGIVNDVQSDLKKEIQNYYISIQVLKEAVKDLKGSKSKIKFIPEHTNYNLVLMAIIQIISLKEDEIDEVVTQLKLAEEMFGIIQDFNNEDSSAVKKFITGYISPFVENNSRELIEAKIRKSFDFNNEI